MSDEWEAYQGVLPANRQRVPAKGSGLTSYIERFHNTLRQRGSRFVRETFSFSQKLANHIGAVWYFVHHYNAQLLPACDPITTFSGLPGEKKSDHAGRNGPRERHFFICTSVQIIIKTTDFVQIFTYTWAVDF